VADHEVRLDAALPDRRQDGQARRDESRLLDLGLDELFFRPLEAEAHQVHSGGRAAALEDVPRLGHGGGDLATHPDLQ